MVVGFFCYSVALIRIAGVIVYDSVGDAWSFWVWRNAFFCLGWRVGLVGVVVHWLTRLANWVMRLVFARTLMGGACGCVVAAGGRPLRRRGVGEGR